MPNPINMAAIVTILYFVFPCGVRGQEQNILQNECASLQGASSPDLVQFLNAVIPDKDNGNCVTWSIRRLGDERYTAAVPALVRLLGFRRPPTPRERSGYVMHPMGVWDLYPATGALALIGPNALPTVLQAIEADSTSPNARENALFVWMEIHKYERAKGVALLKQEETNAHDDATKQRLRMAISDAVSKWCGPKDEAECKSAANPAQH